MFKSSWLCVVMMGGFILCNSQASEQKPENGNITLENTLLRYVISPQGQCLHFVDKTTGDDYAVIGPVAKVKKEGRFYDAEQVRMEADKLIVDFASAQVAATIQIIPHDRYLVLNVVDVTGSEVEELVFCDIKLNMKGCMEDSFQACMLALNLQTRVNDIPGPTNHLVASCYPRFGFAGAKAAILACPGGELRELMKEVVQDAPELPHNLYGGPWALDAQANRGSYLFDFGDVTEDTVDDWIALINNLGFKQLDFHGGKSLRFGDCHPNPDIYPDGLNSLRRIIDKLHAAGIQAGLHTYAMFIDGKCPWVRRKPHPDLAKSAMFTLAQDIDENDTTIEVVESTENMSATTGFFVRNSDMLQIDDELIEFKAADKESPYAFLECERGMKGTFIVPHKKGARVYQLKQCFGLFAPDGDSALFSEVAAKTAHTFNYCGFDMIYLDALDGSDVMGGGEHSWHYSAKFTFEIAKRLERPALMEMSTFCHHLWYVRSRIGAWDHPNRSHKMFIDRHCSSNAGTAKKMFMPANLGWWAVKTWSDQQKEPTYPDDIEYLCQKALGYDYSLSLMGINPKSFAESPYMRRLAEIFQQYETLRLENYFSETIKANLREPGNEFTLVKKDSDQWSFRPVRYEKHKADHMDGISNVWQVHNEFEAQPLGLRIETLLAAEPYETEHHVSVIAFNDAFEWTTQTSAEGVSADFSMAKEQDKFETSGQFTATNHTDSLRGSWVRWEKTFDPPLNIKDQQGLGVWIYGDGQGELLNIRLTCPHHLAAGIGDHLVDIDFTGWRYVELIEPNGGRRFPDYQWPATSLYEMYRESVDYGNIETISIWLNNLPAGKQVSCRLGPIRALPLVKTKVIKPTITIAGQTLTFPVEIKTGGYLEFRSMSDCQLYDPQGVPVCSVTPQGPAPNVSAGTHTIEFNATTDDDHAKPRANVTVITLGDFLQEKK